MEQARTIPIDVLRQFDIDGALIDLEELKRGHINRTYVATWGEGAQRKRYVHQVVNHRVFQDIQGLMSNLECVTETLREAKKSGKLRDDEVTLRLIKAKNGQTYLQDGAGEYWRTCEYIEDTTTYDVCPNHSVAEEAAAILGRFQRALFDLDPSRVVDTIPHFHHGGRRYVAFNESVKNDVKGRVASCRQEIAFAMERQQFGASLITALESGEIARRVCHNDMKLNNVLFDKEGKKAVCLLDLDTCMSGTVLFDLGDLARNTAVPCAEDEQDLSKVEVDLALYEAICGGYLTEIGGSLSSVERQLMPIAPRVLALILGVRFITDYLNGDTYFRIHRPRHNLDRARTQFQIVKLMEQLENEMTNVVRRV